MIPTRRSSDSNTPDPNKFGKKAYDLTHDRRFWEFAKASNVPEAAAFISKQCGVESLRYLDQNDDAVAKWQALYEKFRNS